MMIERSLSGHEVGLEKVVKSISGTMALRVMSVGPVATVSAQILSGSTIGYLGDEFFVEDLIDLGLTLAQHKQAQEIEDEQDLVD